MNRSWRWSAIAAGLMVPAIGGAGLTDALAQVVPPLEDSIGWCDPGTALRATQQGGPPTILVATTRSDAASRRLRASLPATLGRSYQLAEVDAEGRADWLRQIGITGIPGVAVYVPVEGGVRLAGVRSGVSDPEAISAWVAGLGKGAAPSTVRVDPRVARTSYQQPSSQMAPVNNYAPPAPTPSLPVYAPAPAPAPVYYQAAPAPAPVYYQAAPAPAPVYTTPAPQPVTMSPAAAPILVNPPQQTIVIGPQPAPNILSASPAPPQMFLPAPTPSPAPSPSPAPMMMMAPAPAPTQMMAFAPAPTPTQMMAMAPAPAPTQMVAMAPAPTSTATFVAAAPAAPAASPASMVVALKPLKLKNRIGTGLGQFLIERNKQKFELVQTANLMAAPGLSAAPTFSPAPAPLAYAPAPAPQAYCPPPMAEPQSENLPPLPSPQSNCAACRAGSKFFHRHKN